MLGEIRQRKEKYCIISLVCGILKKKKSYKKRSYLCLPEMGHCSWGEKNRRKVTNFSEKGTNFQFQNK